MKHTAFANAMLELERAINNAQKIVDSQFYYTLHTHGCGQLNDEWYRAMKILNAMTEIKCTINVEWEREEE